MMIFSALLLLLSPIDQALSAIRQMPECQPIIMQIKKDGGFSVIEDKSASFGSQWNPNSREISINPQMHRSVGEIIVSLLFEMHNAATDYRLRYLQECAMDRSISKKSFVRKMEQREWKNWELTCRIINLGKQRGIFPSSAFAQSFETFDRYLKLQVAGGHSEFHSSVYDSFQDFPTF